VVDQGVARAAADDREVEVLCGHRSILPAGLRPDTPRTPM
jgi:hypothetical protein